MSRRARLLATLLTLLLAGGATAFALAAQTPSEPPSIELDSSGPLFSLQGMQPGAAPVERCIALTTRGGEATRLEVSGAVSGPLAQRLRMDVASGSAPAPGAGRSCAGFAAEQTLWSGTLADFPQDGAPVLSRGALAAGASRVFRFRVQLPADAVVSANDTARQDLRWRAELDVPPDPSPPVTTPPSAPPTTPPDGPSTSEPPAARPPAGRDAVPPDRGPFAGRVCRGARACRGRLIVRLTRRGARLHARVHARGDERIRSLTLRIPATLPAERARIVIFRARRRGAVLELAGSVRVHAGARERLVAIPRVPAGTRTVLMRVRVPREARPALVRAACRRARVEARLRTSAGPRRLATTLRIPRARCR